MKYKKVLASFIVASMFLSGCATEKVVLNSKGEVIGYHHKDGTYEYLEGFDENGHPIQDLNDDETELAENDSDSIVNNEKDAYEEDEGLGLEEKYNTAMNIKKIVEYGIEIQKGEARAVLGEGMKSALVDAVVSSLYGEEPTSYLEDDTFFVSLGEYFSIDGGTLAQFELGKQNTDGIVQNGDYAAYSLDNFVFVIGEAKNGAMTGWYLVYDQMEMELYMKNAETGKTASFIKSEDDLYFSDANSSDGEIEEHGFVKTFKDGNKQWRVDMENGNVEYTHGKNFFTGTEYAFDATFGGHDVSYRMFCGATYDDEGSLDNPYVDFDQFGTNMKSIVDNLNPSELSEVEELVSNIGGSAIASIPILDVMDTFTNGYISEIFSNEIAKIFEDKHKTENKMSTYERSLWNEKQKMKSARSYNYHAGQIEGEVDTSVLSNSEAERLGNMSIEERIQEKNEQKEAESKKQDEEVLKRIQEEREQKEAESKKQSEEAMKRLQEEREQKEAENK